MSEKIEEIRRVLDICDDFMNSKMLFIDKKISTLLEAITESSDVYGLLGECMSAFNREKEFDKAFVINPMGKGVFNMPKEEYKVLSLVFCLLADIDSGKVPFDEVVGGYFVNAEGKKDYRLFMERVIIPFKNILADTFGLKEEVKEEQEPISDEDKKAEIIEFPIGRNHFNFIDKEGLEKTFEVVKSLVSQISEILESERKKSQETLDSLMMLNALYIACEEQDFDLVNGLALGLKYSLRGNKNVRFFNRELQEVVEDQIRREEN